MSIASATLFAPTIGHGPSHHGHEESLMLMTPNVLKKCVKINVQIPDDPVEASTAALTTFRHAIEIITAMDDFIPIPDLNRCPRKDVHLLPREKNHLNGWVWRVTIKDTEEERAFNGLLYGKTICLEDNVCIAEVPCLNGTAVPSDWIPKTDATSITRILEAGGTIEFSLILVISQERRRPKILLVFQIHLSMDRSGTAVLVATSQVDMEIGADQGPAAHVGIVGLKPTFGLVPYTGVLSNEFSTDHVGKNS
ncbi:hypothetical protein Clacol_007691 [Clathrus columnatus]|uniref:Amidase domain-containing protein n=1 Tax=Clathrus columnatus TaxID=1419009 RepID=A0AAV5AIC8_9AGAM|nr:hypothetical protein Clacol_007691 [Clathrus columnatus]